MKIIIGHPPNIDQIDSKFHVKDKKGMFYCFTDLYNPDNLKIPEHIMCHEYVHHYRQDGKAQVWWDRYVKDSQFRLTEELVAHRAEFGQYCKDTKDRNLQNKYLHFMSQRLAGDLYDNLLTVQEARQRITMQ